MRKMSAFGKRSSRRSWKSGGSPAAVFVSRVTFGNVRSPFIPSSVA